MGSNEHIIVVANGASSSATWLQSQAEKAGLVIAVDGGANSLSLANVAVDVFFGDCDSVEPSVLDSLRENAAEEHLAPVDKDQTDLELALDWIVAQHSGQPVIVAGAFGGRVDHSLANLLLLASDNFACAEIWFRDETQAATCVTSTVDFSQSHGRLLSLLPVSGSAHLASTSGLRWPLVDQVIEVGPSLGVSNEIIEDSATVTVRQGRLIAIQTNE